MDTEFEERKKSILLGPVFGDGAQMIDCWDSKTKRKKTLATSFLVNCIVDHGTPENSAHVIPLVVKGP